MEKSKLLQLDFDRVYLVSMDKRPDRRSVALENLRAIGIEPEVFPAVDGTFLGLEKRGMTGGMIGCFLSHYIIFREAYYKNLSRILVLEDDCKPMMGFNGFITRALNHIPHNWDFAYLGWYHHPDPKNKHIRVNTYWNKPNAVWGTHCYMVNTRRAIEVVWKGLQKMENQVDVQLNRMVLPVSGLNYYAVVPSAITQYKTKSDVQKGDLGRL